jgi:class 3 adenylate cyclase/alpha-beta hydrolase superfamily lysophospholipase
MEQQIRFCTSSDGTRIAYATVGQGPPLVRGLGWVTHLECEWENPLWRPFIDAISRRYLFVRYDGRGMGLSDRQVSDYSLEAQLRDLEAVVDALGLERFALYGLSQGGPTAITYAVRHPERVSHLILYGSFARMGWYLDTAEGRQRAEAVLTLVRQGWGSDKPAFRQLFTSTFMPDADIDAIRAFNELQRVSASGDNVVDLMTAALDIDVRPLLPRVTVPTLVIHLRGDMVVPFESGRELATVIPGARFLPLDGRNHSPLPNEPVTAAMGKAIYEFLGEGEPAPAGAELAAAGGLCTILFTDVEGSTALTERLGDAKAQELLRTHNSIVRDALKSHGGSQIKHTGDGIMASFPFASRALECAVGIQRAFAAHNQENPDTPIRVRMGLNAGEPVAEDDDLFGTAVQVAARICAHAEPCQILASNVVQELAAGKGFAFSDQGEAALKGLEKPVHLYEVRWQG